MANGGKVIIREQQMNGQKFDLFRWSQIVRYYKVVKKNKLPVCIAKIRHNIGLPYSVHIWIWFVLSKSITKKADLVLDGEAAMFHERTKVGKYVFKSSLKENGVLFYLNHPYIISWCWFIAV